MLELFSHNYFYVGGRALPGPRLELNLEPAEHSARGMTLIFRYLFVVKGHHQVGTLAVDGMTRVCRYQRVVACLLELVGVDSATCWPGGQSLVGGVSPARKTISSRLHDFEVTYVAQTTSATLTRSHGHRRLSVE